MDKELQAQCQHIADMLSDGDKYAAMRKQDMGEDFDENEHTGAWDWLSDVLDIKYIVSGNKPDDFISAQVLVAFGGPNIWVNFDTKTVEGYWGRDHATAYFTDDMSVEEALEELWGMK